MVGDYVVAFDIAQENTPEARDFEQLVYRYRGQLYRIIFHIKMKDHSLLEDVIHLILVYHPKIITFPASMSEAVIDALSHQFGDSGCEFNRIHDLRHDVSRRGSGTRRLIHEALAQVPPTQ